MTYAEFCELQKELAQVEQEYLATWEANKDYRKRGKKLSALALRLNDLQDEIMQSGWYR